MGRSVSTHRYAIETIFLHPEFSDDEDQSFEWECYLDDIRDNVLPEIFPSLTKCNRWQDREDHIIAENGRCEISISEYCGCVAVCLAPLDPDSAFDCAWCERSAKKFRNTFHKIFKGSAMTRMGTFSNGESVYQKL